MKNLVLTNKFKVVKTVKTSATNFKNLKVGDIVEISYVIQQIRSQGSSSRGCMSATISINGNTEYASKLDSMIYSGFEFERID